VPTGWAARLAVLTESASGVVLVILVITLLFSLYRSFQAREELVVTLDALTGVPPSGLQILQTAAARPMPERRLEKSFNDWTHPERLADLGYQLGLRPPQDRPRRQAGTLAQALGRPRQQRRPLGVTFREGELGELAQAHGHEGVLWVAELRLSPSSSRARASSSRPRLTARLPRCTSDQAAYQAPPTRSARSRSSRRWRRASSQVVEGGGTRGAGPGRARRARRDRLGPAHCHPPKEVLWR
jgi:hypothetical protein